MKTHLNRKHLALTLSVLILGSAPNLCGAETFCVGLKNILDQTSSLFRPLRGDFDFSVTAYRGTVAMGPLDECYTEGDSQVMSYKCSQSNIADDGAVVDRLMADYSDQLQQCLGVDLVKRPRVAENTICYTLRPDGNDISIRKYRVVRRQGTPYYRISIDVTVVDLAKRGD